MWCQSAMPAALLLCTCASNEPPHSNEPQTVWVQAAPEGGGEDSEGTLDASELGTRTAKLLACDAAKLTDADKEAARQLFQTATMDYQNAEYKAAAANFERSYALSCAIPLLYNLGVCYERVGDVTSAIAAYEAFMRANPNWPEAPEVRRRLEQLRSQ